VFHCVKIFNCVCHTDEGSHQTRPLCYFFQQAGLTTKCEPCVVPVTGARRPAESQAHSRDITSQTNLLQNGATFRPKRFRIHYAHFELDVEFEGLQCCHLLIYSASCSLCELTFRRSISPPSSGYNRIFGNQRVGGG
jgi:hypothetical protein